MSGTLYQRVIDRAGNVNFVAVAQGAPQPQSAAQLGTALLSSSASVVSSYVSARAGEVSTAAGVAAGGALAPTIYQNAATAIALGLAGDYAGAAMNGIPAIIGIAGCLAAIFTPDKVKGLSDDQIKTAVGALSHEQLIGLLDNAVANVGGGVAGNNAGAGVDGGAGNGAGGLQPAVKTVQSG